MFKVRFLLYFVLSLVLIFPSTSFADGAIPVLDKNELKQLHKQVFDLVIEDKEKDVESLPLFKIKNTTSVA
ncbi:hypothetical protein [Paenibacillus sp. y28]|uniref:hypothetical protein n=1 Tax=Paenibacillus sp. y28 TaxID=3129110 RepID=UPI0030183C5C